MRVQDGKCVGSEPPATLRAGLHWSCMFVIFRSNISRVDQERVSKRPSNGSGAMLKAVHRPGIILKKVPGAWAASAGIDCSTRLLLSGTH